MHVQKITHWSAFANCNAKSSTCAYAIISVPTQLYFHSFFFNKSINDDKPRVGAHFH